MAGRGNRTGVAYSLTVIAPIAAGHEETVRERIESMPVGEASPLARLDDLHFSRVQIFDHLVFQGRPQKPDQLRACHLVFTSTFDGELDPYLDALCARLGADADTWWEHCPGYPGTADRVAFKRFIRDYQVDSNLFAAAYPQGTVAGVREALALRARIVDFAAGTQGLGAAELQQRFRETFASR
jgi:hypothetical protein